MMLHKDRKLFSDTIRAASQFLDIKLEFVEKDYWITLVLSSLAQSKYVDETVFKGGTSLSKGYALIDRFSEDVDIAVLNTVDKSGNVIKNLIRAVEKQITSELEEIIVDGVTSKGSRFRKSVYGYDPIEKGNESNKLIIEINSFANPFPNKVHEIKSMVAIFLQDSGNKHYIDKYNLQPFQINVLQKEQTLLEKLVSLIRVSYEENAVLGISEKIRHFYDIYYLMEQKECRALVDSMLFKEQLHLLLEHDKALFQEPSGWVSKSLSDSPLVKDFPLIWEQVKARYQSELTGLAYRPIPEQDKVAACFTILLKAIV